jgi:NO-binding membrane sensor protein with MHYT domain
MHFVAMLAFIMPIPMSYDIGLTTLSLMVAILVTGAGFYVISRKSASPLHLVFSGSTTNCVTDIFMAHLRIAQSNRGSPAP